MKIKSGTTLRSYLFGLRNSAEVLSRCIGRVNINDYRGPHRFFRATGFNAKGMAANTFFGEWWADESSLIQIGGLLETSGALLNLPESTRDWPLHYQALIATSHDWDKRCEISVLEIPIGQELQGLCGIARNQPEYTVFDPFAPFDPEKIYVDRAEHVYFAVPKLLWVHKINFWQL